jgi:hypothetical protein
MRKALIVAMAVLVAAAAGFGAGYVLWGTPTDW